MAGLLESAPSQSWLDAEIGRGPEDLTDDVARVTLTQRLLHLVRDDLDDIFR